MKCQERGIDDVNKLTAQEMEKKIFEYTKDEKKTQEENINEKKVEKRGNEGRSRKEEEFTSEDIVEVSEFEEKYEEDEDLELDMEEITKLVKYQENELEQKTMEIQRMNDTVDTLKKEVARYKEYAIKEQTYIEEL